MLIEKTNRLKKTTPEAFIQKAEAWAHIIAEGIKSKNDPIAPEHAFIIGRGIIQQIICLRLCEEMGMEAAGQLKSLSRKTDIFLKLQQISGKAAKRYHSEAFNIPENKSLWDACGFNARKAMIDDSVLSDLLNTLYSNENTFEFSSLSINIPGVLHEFFIEKEGRHKQFAGERNKIRRKRKRDGVFYTPDHIVRYISEETLSRLLGSSFRVGTSDERKPAVLDPACGAGWFLVQSYRYLLDRHRTYYLQEPAKWSQRGIGRLRRRQSGWELTFRERARILVDHIYGVDLDPRAVELTKLSLIFALFETSRKIGIPRNSLFGDYYAGPVPDLRNNIKCGNSLIESDYFSVSGNLFKKKMKDDMKVFDWKKRFPAIMKSGGFDAVMGNPPWGGDIDSYLEYLHVRYRASSRGHTDIFKCFIERSVNLTKENGFLCMITPAALLRQRRFSDIRSFLMKYKIHEIIQLGDNVFRNVTAPSCIFLMEKSIRQGNEKTILYDLKDLLNTERKIALQKRKMKGIASHQSRFIENPDFAFGEMKRHYTALSVPLGRLDALSCRDAGINYQRKNVGMQEKGYGSLSKRLLYEGAQEKTEDMMYWKGSDINRYWIAETTNRFCRTNYREFTGSNETVTLNRKVFETAPKILIRQTADRIIAAVDYRGIWFGRSLIAILPARNSPYSIEYFLGLLNSQRFNDMYQELVDESGRAFPQVKLSKIKQLPVRTIDFENPSEKKLHDDMANCVKKIIAFKRKQRAPGEKASAGGLKQEIESYEKKIDALTYALYNV